MLFPIKPEDEMLQEMLEEVSTSIGTTNLTPGSIVRTLLEVFNRRLGTCYRYLDLYTSMSFLSTAEGMYLDMIGNMLSCPRLDLSESDGNYRYRISQQVFTMAAANRTALMLKCLAVEGVKNIILTPYSRGNGSFTMHVIADEIETPNAILAAVEAQVLDSKAEGIRGIVASPRAAAIDVTFSVVPRTGTSINELVLASQVKQALTDYLDNIPMGGSFSITELGRITGQNASVAEVYTTSMYVDDEAVILTDMYQLEWDQRPYVRNVIVIV